MTSKVSKSKKLLLNGIFGVIKDRGYTIDDYKTWIRLTHYDESSSFNKGWSSPAIILDIKPRYMEPLSTGVLCIGIGFWATKLTALTQFWRHVSLRLCLLLKHCFASKEWVVGAKLGTQTQNYCTDSPVINQKPFDHINEELLDENLKQFIGLKEQLIPPFISTPSLLIPKTVDKKPTQSVVKPEPTPRIRKCESIEVLAFDPPHLKLKIISDGQFSCRQFVNDLGLKLNSCAHLTQLHLNTMGVITSKECLKKYELHCKQISEAIDKYSKLCSKDLQKFEDLKTSQRRII